MTNRRQTLRASAIFVAVISTACAFSAHASVKISSKPTQNMNCAGGVCTATAPDAVLNVTDLATMLSSGDVTVSPGSLAKDIDLSAALTWTSANRLTLDAYRGIQFDKPVVVAGTGALTITTNDGGMDGDFSFSGKGHVEFWDLSSNLVINGKTYWLFKSFKTLAKHIRNGSMGYYALARDVNAKNRIYASGPIREMDGVIEGLGNKVSNLTISDPLNFENVGLVQELGADSGIAAIRHLTLENANVTASGSSSNAGTLVGENFGEVSNVFVSGAVSVTGSQSAAGGLVGLSFVGAIWSAGANVTVTGAGSDPVGGIAGISKAACAGSCDGSIDQSYASGAVTGGDGSPVGGLVGANLGALISNSYASGQVSGGSNAFVGGLVGSNQNDPQEQSIASLEASYSFGSVSGSSGSSVGGLIGQDLADGGLSNLYWNLDTSGVINTAQGAGNIPNDPGIFGLTSVQLRSGLPSGFATSVWREETTVNGGFPFLLSVSP
jgi:The GLUG motif